MAEPLACVLNGEDLARVGVGDAVAVVGSGPIGCLHVWLARVHGAARVFLIDLNRERPDFAAALVNPDAAVCGGETDAVDAIVKLTDGRGADVVVTAAASGATQEQTLQMAPARGRISFVGGLPTDRPDDHGRLQPCARTANASPKTALAANDASTARAVVEPSASLYGCTLCRAWET